MGSGAEAPEETARTGLGALIDLSINSIRNWGAVGWRSALYGSISCSVGWMPRGRRVSQWAMLRWSREVSTALGIEAEFFDAELLDQAPQAILAANHLSTMDILVLGMLLDRDYRWLAKASLFKVPFSGWHLKLAGHIPVYRGAERDRNRSIGDRIHDVVQEGASVLFFPEGTRSEDGQLKRFRIGAFATAVREDLPVVPLAIRGTREIMAKGTGDVARGKSKPASVRVLPPVYPPEGASEEARAEALRDLVHAALEAELTCSSASLRSAPGP